MIENLKDEVYQLENKQEKRAKLDTTLLWLIVGGGIKMESFPKNPSPLKFSNDLKQPPSPPPPPSPTIRHKGVISDRRWRAKNAPTLSSKYLIHGIGTKLSSNWEQNMLYNKS